MKPKLFFIIIVAVCFSWMPVHTEQTTAEPIKVEEVTAGFDGYYRPGEFIPLRFKLRTEPTPFEGFLEIITERLIYKKILAMPASASQDVSLTILVDLPVSEIKYRFFSEGNYLPVQSIPVKPVEPARFLIGVEREIFPFFISEFTRYTDAARHSYFFSFTADELPNHVNALESIDLLVISDELRYQGKLREVLELWRDGLKGNVLVVGNRLDLSRLGQLQPRLPKSQEWLETLAGLYPKPRWFDQIKYPLDRLLALYLLLTLVLVTVIIWLRHKTKKGLVSLLSLVGLNILIIPLILVTDANTPDFVTEQLKVITLHYQKQIIKEDNIVNINPQRTKDISVDLSDELVKPFCRDGRQTPSFLVSDNNKNASLVIPQTHNKLPYFLLQQSLRKTEPVIRFNLSEISNKTGFDLNNCFVLAPAGVFVVGKIADGETRNLIYSSSDLAEWDQFIAGYLTESKRLTIYHKKILEVWYQKYLKSGTYFIGWQENSSSRPGGTELWIIPLEE